MKKISFLILAAAVIAGLSACNKLQYEPEDSLTPEAAFTDVNGVQNAITGCYSLFQGGFGIDDGGDFSFDIISMPSCFSDEGIFSGTFTTRQEFSMFNITTANLTNRGIYSTLYAIAVRTNDVIDRINTTTDIQGLTPDLKNHFLSELYTIRAYAYFYLANYYGDVPLILQPTNSETLQENNDHPNTPKAEIMAQVEKDLQFALDNFGGGGGGSRISIGAIQAFMARVKLYEGKWDEARTLAEGLIDGGVYSLDPDYDHIFTDGRTSPEVIWYIDYSKSNQSGIAFYFLSPDFNGRQEVSVRDTAMFNGSTEVDLRKATTIQGDMVYKYREVATGSDPVILFRLGEQYLIAAEAEARLGNYGKASDYVNDIRDRAGLTNEHVTLDADNYIDLILQERKLELAFEMGGHRLLDLRRTGKAVEVLGPLGYVSPKCDLWPFPQADRDANPNLKQNPFY